MTASSHLRGHPITWDALRCEWVYCDNRDATAETWRERPCGHCGEHGTTEGHDACLGTLPGVMNACCGHGQDSEAYVQHWNGECVRGTEALGLINQLKATAAGEE